MSIASVLASVSRKLLGTVLLVSSFFHFASPYEFVGKVHAYGLTSPEISLILAFTLPILQTVLGIGICFEAFSRGSALVTSILFLVFATAQSFALSSGKDISCGCMGEYSLQISGFTILSTLILFGLSLFVSFIGGKK